MLTFMMIGVVRQVRCDRTGGFRKLGRI